MKKTFIILNILFSMISCEVFAQTLCEKTETDYFSCETTNHKIASICGSLDHDEDNLPNWLQYRFGRANKIELTYPDNKTNSIQKFEGNWFHKYDVIDLRFINGNVGYSLILSDVYDGEDAQKREKVFGGVDVHLRGKENVSIACQSVDIKKYYSVFSKLNVSLRAHNGDTDIFYKEKLY